MNPKSINKHKCRKCGTEFALYEDGKNCHPGHRNPVISSVIYQCSNCKSTYSSWEVANRCCTAKKR